MIDHETWHIIELIIRRYPAIKKQYDEYIDQVMTSSPAPAAGLQYSEDYCRPQSVTEAKAFKMTSLRAETLKKQIEAVELVYKNLKPEEKKLMEKRFWSDQRRNIPYTKIKGVAYSERQMRRIVKKIVSKVGVYLGEI